MNCTFVATGNGDEKKCSTCGNRVVTPHPAERCFAECGPRPSTAITIEHTPFANSPGFFRKIAHFAKAAIEQIPLAVEAAWTGEESVAIRSREEIEANYKICQACEYLKDGSCSHPACGCAINVDRSIFWSKLAWRSAHCPLTPPKW